MWPLPDANAALALSTLIEDYNTVHPHSRLGYRSPREYIATQSNPPRVRSNGINPATLIGPPRSDNAAQEAAGTQHCLLQRACLDHGPGLIHRGRLRQACLSPSSAGNALGDGNSWPSARPLLPKA